MAMYFIFAIGILINYMVSKKNLNKYQIPPSLTILFLLRMIFLLQSKAGMLTIIAIATFLFIISLIRVRSLLLKIALSILIVSISFVMVQKSSRLQAMISSVKEISKKGESEDTTTGIRFEIWKIAVKEIHHSWFLGVGAGDIKPVLFKDYKNKSLNGALDKNLNVHNQYLETFLGQGILGIGLLLLLLYWGILKASRTREILNSIFVLLIILSMGPESMLNNEAGVVFIAFFYYFLFIFNLSEDEESQTILL
jgi:O-antigen ligase